MKYISIKNLILILILCESVSLDNELQQIENKIFNIMEEIHRIDHLEYLLHLKICDESTLEGDTTLTENEANAIFECEKLDDDQELKETEAISNCIKKAYQGMSTRKILYNTLCNQTKNSLHYDVYTQCMNNYHSDHFSHSKFHQQIKKAKDRKQKLNLKVKHLGQFLNDRKEVIKCYNKSVSQSIDLNYDQKHHKYEFENEIFINCYALNDEKSRNESFVKETEPKKISEFIKCYQLLDSDCHSIFNKTYLDYFNKYNNENKGTNYEKFIISRMSGIYELIARCQIKENGKMKAIDYYPKQKEIFAKLNECQRTALQMSKVELDALEQRQYFYIYDF